MELKVWIDGVPREVCGVTDKTSCEEVIFALAQAACLPGYYTLIANWRGNEITLAPDEKPLVVINRLGENPKDFYLNLRRLGNTWNPPPSNQPIQKKFSPSPYLNVGPSKTQNLADFSKNRNKPPDNLKSILINQITSQENELEQNKRIILNLNKELEKLELTSQQQPHYANFNDNFGPSAELNQLSSTPWVEVLENNKRKNFQLQQDKSKLEFSLKDVERRIKDVKGQVIGQEAQLKKIISSLIDDIELLNRRREEIFLDDSKNLLAGSSPKVANPSKPGVLI